MPAVKVGIPVSLTGQFQTQGRQALAGLQAWARDVNLDGGLKVGLLRRPLKIIHYDDASLGAQAATATRRLIEADRVDLLFGPYSSGLARAAAEVAGEYGQLLWNQGGAADTICQPGRRVVGILSGAGDYLAALPRLIRDADPSAATYAVLRCSAGAFSRQVSEGMEARALSQGFTRVLLREFPPEQTDFTDQLNGIAEVNPDLLLAVGRIRHDIAVAQGLASQWTSGHGPRVAAVVAAPIKRFQSELGHDSEGFVGPSQWEPPARESVFAQPELYFGPAPGQAVNSLRRAAATAGVPVDYPMAQSYVAGVIAQRCLEEDGSLEPELLWQAATALDFHTFFGRFKIDPETGRQTGRSVFLVQWQRSRKVVIWPPEHAQGSLALHHAGTRPGV